MSQHFGYLMENFAEITEPFVVKYKHALTNFDE